MQLPPLIIRPLRISFMGTLEHLPSPLYLYSQIHINQSMNSSPWFLGLYPTVTSQNETILAPPAFSVTADML